MHRMAAGAWLALAAMAAWPRPPLPVGLQDALLAAGPQAGHVLDLWRIVVFVCTAVFTLVLLAFLYGIWKAPRAGKETPADLTPLHKPETKLQSTVAWATGVSATLLLGLIIASVFTDRALAHMNLRDALHVEVTAHQWWWELHYDDNDASRRFTTANELHVPVGRPVILTLKADDVIHSFWVPSIAGKKDLIPGHTTTHAFRIDRRGNYRGQCAEFCGAQHAWMAFLVVADPPRDYEAWAAHQRQPAPAPGTEALMQGQQVFMNRTCAMCHGISGTSAAARKGPDLTHLGSRQTLGAGALPNKPDQLAEWIRDPHQFKPGVNMPAHTDLPPQELQALATYLGSLQ